jgi:hypothetical protein
MADALPALPVCPGLIFLVLRRVWPDVRSHLRWTSDTTKGRTCPLDPLQVCGHRGPPLHIRMKLSADSLHEDEGFALVLQTVT